MKKTKAKKIIDNLLSNLTLIAFMICLFFSLGLFSMAFWNYIIVKFFEVQETTFWPAFGISFGTSFIIGLLQAVNKKGSK